VPGGTGSAAFGCRAMAPSAQQAAAQSGSGSGVIGWKLDRDEREGLLRRFPPRYRNVVADHVTLKVRAALDAPLPEENEGEIVGRADDGRGVEAMAVRIRGTTDRPDGSTYHVTWSLENGRSAKESNDVLAAQRFVPLDEPVPIALRPARWP
jgi:hypothetical protein